ncbi:MAG: His-Xaa-Ser system protein HxsD [Myxococcales bacterium]|nr:His-Xaa-Ser system protein HxsD [Myxococcales bacterium]
MSEHSIETFDAAAGRMTLALDTGLYPLEVVYGAAYIFIDRAFVLLDREGESGQGRYLVHLRTKQGADETKLRALSGEFGNELLSQALRRKVVKANQKIIEEITTQAIAGAAGGALPTDFLGGADDGLDFLDDPLGIAVPWEEKFKKKKPDAADPTSAAAIADAAGGTGEAKP